MARKPYVELPDILKLLPSAAEVDTEPEVGGPGGLLNQIKDLYITRYILRDGWYDDSALIPSQLVLYDEPFTVELEFDVGLNEADELKWEVLQDGEVIFQTSGNLLQSFNISDYVNPQQLQQNRVFEVRAVIERYRFSEERGTFIPIGTDVMPEVAFSCVSPPTDDNQLPFTPVYEPFVAKINDVNGDTIEIDVSYDELVNRIRPDTNGSKQPNEQYGGWTISSKFGDRKDLNTYLHFGDDKRYLVTNVKYDNQAVPTLPYSVIYKTYEPLPDDISEKDFVYVVREVLPPLTETVELVGYAQEDEEFQVLIPRDNFPQESPITKRQTEFKTFDDLVTSEDPRLKDDIEDKFLQERPVELSVDYSRYENFINFSSAQKRLENFKYKIEQIEKETQLSSSFIGVTNADVDLNIHHNKIRDIKNNFDGYENYLYNIQSSYVTSSLGQLFDAS